MIEGSQHNETHDWWGFGVLIYEMLFGQPPFQHNNPEVLFHLILKNNVAFPDRIRHGIIYTKEAKDIIQLLLNKDKTKRLGRNGLDEVLSHKWFADLDRHDMEAKKIPSTYNFKANKASIDEKKNSRARITSLEESPISAER